MEPGPHKIGGAEAAHKLYVDSLVGMTLKNKAQEWIRTHKSQPFFLYFPTTNIHHPFTPARRFLGSSNAGWYGDFVHELDWMVGEIMATLEEEGLADNTLIILTSDNGGMLNRGGQDAYAMEHFINGELLSFKFDAWEGGHRIPFIARWPGKIEPGTVSNQLISNVDMLATFAGIVDASITEGQAADSQNLLPVLLGKAENNLREELLIAPNDLRKLALRKGKWMYISGQGGGGFAARHEGAHTFGGPGAFPFTGQQNSDIENGRIKLEAPPAQLYNLEEDLVQRYNVYEAHPEVVKEMKERMREIVVQ